jgi:hypothetical protein
MMNIFFLTSLNYNAKGYFLDGRFTINKGSIVRVDLAPSFPKSQIVKRDELISSGILVKGEKGYLFSVDYTCNSPSEASNLVMGTSSNGLLCWKDKNGRSLKSFLRELENNI